MTAVAGICTFFADASPTISGWQENDIIAALLILVLGMALGIGLVCLLLVLHYMRGGRLAARRGLPMTNLHGNEKRLDPSTYLLPQRWLAIRSGNPRVVQAALGLHRPTPCSWEEGLS